MNKTSNVKFYLLTSIFGLLFLLNGKNAIAQFAPLDKGGAYPVVATSDDTDYYVSQPDSSYLIKKVYYVRIVIKKWNGTFWSNYPPFTIYGDTNTFTALKVIKYKNEIYVTGKFDSAMNIPGSGNILKWSGKSWSGVGGGLQSGSPVYSPNSPGFAWPCAVVFNNKLFVSGYFTNAGKVKATNIASWDGAQWSALGDSISGEGINQDIWSMLEFNGKIWVFGAFKKAGSLGVNNIACWNDTQWSATPYIPRSGVVMSSTIWKNKIWVCGYDSNAGAGVYSLDSSGWTDHSSFNKKYNALDIFNIQAYGNKLWISGWFEISGKPSRYALLQGDGNTYYDYGGILNRSAIYSLTPYKNRLIAGGNLTNVNNIQLNGVGYISGTSFVTGNVYNDLDSNCKYDTGETIHGNRFISIDSGKYYTCTDDNGNFGVFLDSGMHSISVIPTKAYKQTCPPFNASLIVNTLPDSTYSGYNFAIKPFPGVKDLQVKLSCNWGYTFHPRATQEFTIDYENIGTTTLSGKIYFQKPGRLINFSASPKADSFSNPKAYWSFSALAPGDKGEIIVKLNADTGLKQGDSLQFYAFSDAALTSVDSDKTNNADTLIMVSGNSHDPNGKQSFPPADITQSTKEIKYHIDFQNTGTASAYQVVVIDTIDVNLPLTKVIMNSASHKYRLDINNNVFRWTFENINLPDSNDDVEGSHGYISYTTQIKPGLAVGTEIKNKAYIYFDYNDPILTNETMNKMGIRTSEINPVKISESIKLYPNPANEELMIDNRSPETKKFIIYNSVGQAMTQLQIGKDQREILNTTAFPAGIYFIRGEKGESAKFVIQH